MKKCQVSSNQCFWKHPDDIISQVKTRSKSKNEPSVNWRVINRYYEGKQKDKAFN